MAGILRLMTQSPQGRVQKVTKSLESLTSTDWIRHKFTKSRIPDEVFQPSPAAHKKYGGDPQHPHKLHVVTRIKSVQRRPYWEKEIIKLLGLEKAHTPQVHKNIPSVNAKLKVVKHLIRIQPLKLPQGLPTEGQMSETCLKTTGELVVRWHLRPLGQKPDVYPGNCWAFRGPRGFVVVRFSAHIQLTAVTLEHVPKALSPNSDIPSAPKDFVILGLNEDSQMEGVALGQFTYENAGEAIQTFPFQGNGTAPYQLVELRVLSNWGHPDYTCIYRFWVHGKPAN